MSLFMGIVTMGEVGLWGRYRGAMVALIWHGWESRGDVLDRRNGGEKRFFFSFSFFGEVVGCGSDGEMVFR